jgi:hypothetical protein
VNQALLPLTSARDEQSRASAPGPPPRDGTT